MYEEYVAAKPTRVLDGAIFSLFGIQDYLRVTKKGAREEFDLAQKIFDKGILGLKHWLPKYDMGFLGLLLSM